MLPKVFSTRSMSFNSGRGPLTLNLPHGFINLTVGLHRDELRAYKQVVIIILQGHRLVIATFKCKHEVFTGFAEYRIQRLYSVCE